MTNHPWLVCCILATAASTLRAANFEKVATTHPAGDALKRFFASGHRESDFTPTGLTKKDYLRLVAGIVDYWKKYQDDVGAIIDWNETDAEHPKGLEKQYSTPCFALAAAELVKEAGRDDLLDPAVRAFSFALTALVNKTTADQHPDFYIPMLMHAHRILKSRVPAAVVARWEEQLKSIIPREHYRGTSGGGNWNIVNIAGELMRRKDGLVATAQLTPQQEYLDQMFERQQQQFTKFGMYYDANGPLAYDAFPRMWLEDALADGAYTDGKHREPVENFLLLGGFSSMLLLSPQGEWPCGGRSGHHQWNEAQTAVIAECNALKWKAVGRDDIAGAFKRMARMCLKSMFRWQRPSGEMWIVKNFAEPQTHFGFEVYSCHSQYNLLPAAMLCIAYERADDSIDEKPMPSEYGAYVFDLRDRFTTIAAAAGGYYVLINTSADAHYDATGLQRIHRRGVELSPLTDSAAQYRAYLAAKDDPSVALAPGIQWKDGDEWIGLANFHRFEPPPQPKEGEPPRPPAPPQRAVTEAKLAVEPAKDRAVFSIEYVLDGPGAREVLARYTISADGVSCEQSAGGGERRFVFPLLVNDAVRDTKIDIVDGGFTVSRVGGTLRVKTQKKVSLAGPRIATHNGYVQAAIVDCGDETVRWHATLEP